MTQPICLLFVDDDDNILQSIKRLFFNAGYTIHTANSGAEGLKILESGTPVHVVVSDYRMQGMNGVEFLQQVSHRWPDTIRMVLSGYADTPAVVGAINNGGIYKFITKPWNDDELRITVANAATLYFLQRRIRELMLELKTKDDEIARLKEELKKRP